MVRPDLERTHSEFYPPRARWYSGLLHPWFALHRALHLERIHLPGGLSTLQFWLSLLVPGYAFIANGRRILGWSILGVYFLAGALFVIALGYPAGGIGYGLMISAHASSLIFLEGYWLRDRCRFGLRLVFALATLLAVWMAFYSPLVGFAERHWIMPLRVRNQVVIVRRLVSARGVRRGESGAGI